MSNLTKILIMLVAWLIFAFLTLKTCIQPTCCGAGGEDTTQVVPPPVPTTKDYALVTSLGKGDVLQGDLWPDLRSRLLAEYRANPDQELEIYGHYYADEASPDGYENMGFYRAELIKNMLIPDIPADQIRLLSKRLDRDLPEANALWDAGSFNWHAKNQETEIIEIDDEITIRFPFNSDEKNPDPAIDAYLLKLAQRLGQTNERVAITGHTDNIGTDEFNMRLGQRRADFIKNILVGHGVATNRITTRSEGESNPVDTNTTDRGRQNNRRAVVKLTAAQ